jgi:hypothetical protein
MLSPIVLALGAFYTVVGVVIFRRGCASQPAVSAFSGNSAQTGNRKTSILRASHAGVAIKPLSDAQQSARTKPHPTLFLKYW